MRFAQNVWATHLGFLRECELADHRIARFSDTTLMWAPGPKCLFAVDKKKFRKGQYAKDGAKALNLYRGFSGGEPSQVLNVAIDGRIQCKKIGDVVRTDYWSVKYQDEATHEHGKNVVLYECRPWLHVISGGALNCTNRGILR